MYGLAGIQSIATESDQETSLACLTVPEKRERNCGV